MTTPVTPASGTRRLTVPEQARGGLLVVAVMTALMWVVQVINSVTHYVLDRDGGIISWRLSGLDGLVFAPFLHAGWGHLIANTVPFVVLGAVIALAGAARVLVVTAFSAVVGGLGTWLVNAPNTLTVGASGVVFGFAAYLVFRGAFSRRLGELALGVLVIIVYGGSLLFSLIPREGVSWQGHLFGAVGGVLAAWWLHRRARRRAAATDSSSRFARTG